MTVAMRIEGVREPSNVEINEFKMNAKENKMQILAHSETGSGFSVIIFLTKFYKIPKPL